MLESIMSAWKINTKTRDPSADKFRVAVMTISRPLWSHQSDRYSCGTEINKQQSIARET